LKSLAASYGSQASLVMAEYDRRKRAFDVTEDHW
jgi:predicted secreted Zn-dependent protease